MSGVSDIEMRLMLRTAAVKVAVEEVPWYQLNSYRQKFLEDIRDLTNERIEYARSLGIRPLHKMHAYRSYPEEVVWYFSTTRWNRQFYVYIGEDEATVLAFCADVVIVHLRLEKNLFMRAERWVMQRWRNFQMSRWKYDTDETWEDET